MWVLDGDGSLVMNLGSLVTIAQQAPANLLHVLLENGVYEVTGGQPVPGAGLADFATMARAAGYRSAYRFDTLAALEASLDEVLAAPGPTFVTLVVEEAGAAPRKAYPPTRHALAALRDRPRRGLGRVCKVSAGRAVARPPCGPPAAAGGRLVPPPSGRGRARVGAWIPAQAGMTGNVE